MQTSKGEQKTKKSKAKASKAATSNPNPDVQELPQTAFSSETEDQQLAPAVQLLDLNKVVSSTYNPRKDFRSETLQELADSIRQVGVLQPICVRPKENGFEIVYGERRYWAAAMAGLKFIPALVRELSDAEAEDAAITENLQREDLNAIEEAQGIKALMDTLSLTQDEAAERVGKSRPAVANALRLLKLPDSVIALVSDGKLSPGHARALLGFKDEQDIIETADLIIEKGLTVRDVEKLVKKRNKEPKAEKPAARRASYYDEVELALTDFLGRKVKVGTKPGKESGVLEIDFFDKDDLTRLADALKSLGD